MKFCSICDNMLYMSVVDRTKLTFYCKNCSFVENVAKDEDDSPCVSAKLYTDDAVSYTNYVNPNIKYDNTLPRVNNIVCPQCKPATNEVIYIKYNGVNMKYLYHCCHCAHFWTVSEYVGKVQEQSREPEHNA